MYKRQDGEDDEDEEEDDDNDNDADEMRGNERDNMNIVTPLSTRSTRSDDSKSDSVKKRRSSDDNNMLTGKSSNYYNDIRREQANHPEKKEGVVRKQMERMSPSRKGGFRRMAYSKLESVAGSREEMTRLGDNETENVVIDMNNNNNNNNNKLRYYRMDNIEEEPHQQQQQQQPESDDPSTASSRGFRRIDTELISEVNEKAVLNERKSSVERFYNGRECWSTPLNGADPDAIEVVDTDR